MGLAAFAPGEAQAIQQAQAQARMEVLARSGQREGRDHRQDQLSLHPAAGRSSTGGTSKSITQGRPRCRFRWRSARPLRRGDLDGPGGPDRLCPGLPERPPWPSAEELGIRFQAARQNLAVEGANPITPGVLALKPLSSLS